MCGQCVSIAMRLGPALCLWNLIGAGPAAADIAATRPAEDAAALKERIARAVKDLGADSWRVREEASRRLWEIGRPAQTALEQAADSDDPEVRARARRILEKFKYGIYPDTPDEVVELIQKYRRATPGTHLAIVRYLLQKGAPGCRAVLALAKAEENKTIRGQLAAELSRRVAKVAPVLLADTFGVLWASHVSVSTPLHLAAGLHVGAATPNFLVSGYPTSFGDSSLGTALCTASPVPEGGSIEVSDAPGLGVTLDEDRVEWLTALYESRTT